MEFTEKEKQEILVTMSMVKMGTLTHYLTDKEVRKNYGCDYEFDLEGETGTPINLHTWVGKNHRYREKYHKVFVIPEPLRIPLIQTDNMKTSSGISWKLGIGNSK